MTFRLWRWFFDNVLLFISLQWKVVIFTFSCGEMSFELIMIYAGLMWEGAEPDTLISRQIECFSTKLIFPLFFLKLYCAVSVRPLFSSNLHYPGFDYSTS